MATRVSISERVTSRTMDIEKETSTITGIFAHEPLSAEEIERKFKIDIKKWRLIQYWNKEKEGGGYFVSANIARRKSDIKEKIDHLLHEAKLKYTPIKRTYLNPTFTDPTCAVLSLQDIHVSKKSIDNLDTIEADVKRVVETLTLRSYHSFCLDKIIFVLGGDLLNMDTYGGTTTEGTLVDNTEEAHIAFRRAFDLMFWCITYLKQFCNTLEVVYVPGNHSRLTESHIAYTLSKCIKDESIIWNIDYEERKVIQYGVNMLCFEHGDFDTKKSFFVFATEYAKIWGDTNFRTVYTGHFHKKKTIEYVTEDEISGFQLKILPSLSRTDRYHHSNKWKNKRGGVIELHSMTDGLTGTFSDYFKH